MCEQWYISMICLTHFGRKWLLMQLILKIDLQHVWSKITRCLMKSFGERRLMCQIWRNLAKLAGSCIVFKSPVQSWFSSSSRENWDHNQFLYSTKSTKTRLDPIEPVCVSYRLVQKLVLTGFWLDQVWKLLTTCNYCIVLYKIKRKQREKKSTLWAVVLSIVHL